MKGIIIWVRMGKIF